MGVMDSFVSGHNASVFICSKLIMTHQASSSLAASPYLKLPVFFFPPF